MDSSREVFLQEVSAYQRICVYRHQHPDGDAQGSQWAMVLWLKEHYPEKEIYACGFHNGTYPHYYPELDEVSDEIISGSLSIVLDTANRERVDDVRFENAARVIKIDHHPGDMNYGDVNLIYPHFSSTCEILTDLLKDKDSKPYTEGVAKFLYTGLLTDTLRFSVPSTTANTLACASFLAQSNIDIAGINEEIFTISQAEFALSTYIRSHCTVLPSGLVYILLDDQTIRTLQMPPAVIKNRVNDFGGVAGFEVWALFLELRTEEGSLAWSGSLRSKHYTINDIAFSHGGGGHRLACAVKNVSLDEVHTILAECNTRCEESV